MNLNNYSHAIEEINSLYCYVNSLKENWNREIDIDYQLVSQKFNSLYLAPDSLKITK